MPEHETFVDVETRYHPSGAQYTWAIASCDGCDWASALMPREAKWLHDEGRLDGWEPSS